MHVRVEVDPELLLAHSAWIRGLARRLAGAEAEDLVQDAWLEALERPRGEVRSLRDWLGGLLTNVARQTRRGEARRRVREQRSACGARKTCEPSAADTFEAASTGRELADLVLALEEPFRTVVLLRYYEDLPPRRIAKRLAVPVRTVNSRLSRGLERLREGWKLRHGEEGDGDAWVRSLLFLAGSPPSAVPAAAGVSGAALPLGVALMNAKTWLAVAVVGTGAVAWWLSASRTGPREAEIPLAPRSETAALEPYRGDAPLAPATREAESRAAVTSPVPSAPETSAESPTVAAWTVRGRVLDCDALPLAGVEVEYRGSGVPEDAPLSATSGPGGRFELAVPRGGGELWARAPELVTVARGRVSERSEVEPLVVVAPRIELAGRVVDAAGGPLSEVRVHLEHPAGFGARFEAVFDTTEMSGWNTETDERGRFELAGPSIAGARLVAELEGYDPWRGEVPWKGDRDLLLTLARTATDVPVVSGRVVDPENRPVAGAWVTLGRNSTASDSTGEFRLERGEALDAFELRAMKSGHGLGRLRAAADGDGKPVWPAYVVLPLGVEPLSISGRVVDGAGEPREGMRIWIADPTPFGILQDEMLASVEYYLGTEQPGDAYWASVDSEAGGSFRLGGLLERDYALEVMNPRTLEIRTFGPFRAGDPSARIVFEDGELGPVHGRVTTRDGQALAGVSVRILGNSFGGVWSEAASTFSDAEGRFALEGIGGEALMLSVSGDDVMPQWFGAHVMREGEEPMELAVSVRCTFQVDLGRESQHANGLRVLDQDDAGLTLFRIGPSGSLSGNSFPIVEGRSESLGVSDSARTLVLLRDGVEVRRVPVLLRPGMLNLITP